MVVDKQYELLTTLGDEEDMANFRLMVSMMTAFDIFKSYESIVYLKQ